MALFLNNVYLDHIFNSYNLLTHDFGFFDGKDVLFCSIG